MAIKNILVAFNGSDSSRGALNAAILMHGKYGAHLTGLLAHCSQKAKLSEHPWIPENLRNTLNEIENEADHSIEELFRETVGGKVPEDQLHWISRRGDADTTVSQYARMYDLIVVGRYDTVLGTSDLNLHPDRIAMKSGRPVLVVPQSWNPERIHEHAVVAWDGQRAATRAINDAMQILETKTKISVISVDDGRIAKPLPGIDVKTMLGRHVENVTYTIQPLERKSAGDVILNYCKEVGAGLLVMGAYEHSILREELFGGVTRRVMEKMELPVLIAH